MTEKTKNTAPVGQQRWSRPFTQPPQPPARAGAPSLSHAPVAVGVGVSARGITNPPTPLSRAWGGGCNILSVIPESPSAVWRFEP